MDRWNIPVALVVSVLPCLVWFVLGKKLKPYGLPLPPGPEGVPILGSALEINKDAPWVTYSDWRRKYGEIVSFKLLGQNFIVLNSERVANALLDQRSGIYSDRPMIQTSSLFGVEFNTGHLHYNDTWKLHRKLLHQTLSPSMIPDHHDILQLKARDFLRSLLHSPDEFENHTRTYAASIIMSISYGYDVLPKDDPFVGPLEEMIRIIILTTPERAILFNIFPQLAYVPTWFPGAELQRLAVRCKELSPKVRNGPFQYVKDCLEKGIENNSMVAQLLKDETIPEEDRTKYEQNIKDCATSGFIAGTDTTQGVLDTLILVLVLFPEVQKCAQELIDKFVGRDRLPDFNDRPSLVYIEALVWETMRYGSLVPMSVPHMVTKDDIFEQHLIPKGSIVIPNVWGFSRDEEVFPDPEIVKPERHLDADGNLLPTDLSGLAFGHGRRICPGRHLAQSSNWIAAARMLAAFKFEKAIGPAGYPIEVFPLFTGGVSRRPVSFRCSIKPRFEGAEELLN